MKILCDYAVSEIVIKGSRFIAEAFPVKDQAQAREKLHEQKQKYSDATHVCHAFITGLQGETCGMSDDGEPGGTAGRPMLDVLKGSGITNIIITVTRYFGGTLLGTGGLVKAYGDSTKNVIAECNAEEYIPKTVFSYSCDYSLYETFRRKTEVFNITDINEEYSDAVKVSGTIHSSQFSELCELIKNYSKGLVVVQLLENY